MSTSGRGPSPGGTWTRPRRAVGPTGTVSTWSPGGSGVDIGGSGAARLCRRAAGSIIMIPGPPRPGTWEGRRDVPEPAERATSRGAGAGGQSAAAAEGAAADRARQLAVQARPAAAVAGSAGPVRRLQWGAMLGLRPQVPPAARSLLAPRLNGFRVRRTGDRALGF